MDFSGKRVLVCGMAKSGQSAVRLLRTLGADVTAQDLKPADQIDWTFLPEEEGITLYLGKNPDAIIDMFDMVVMSPGIPGNLPFVEKARASNIPVWGEVELAYDQCRCPVIAITGTNGKTTTTTLVGEILQAANRQTAVVGNIGVPFTDHALTLPPEAMVVAEISSFQLETVHRFKPWISAILNITPDHLNRHKTMAAYQSTKERIFMNQSDDGFTVLNYDDPYCRTMSPPCRVVYFSAREALDEGVYLDSGQIHVRLFGTDQNIMDVTKTRVLTENALAATAISFCAGAPLEAIVDCLISFMGVEHRIEYVTTINDISFYNDSKATNTDAAMKALEAMRGSVVLIGGGYDKQAAFDDWVGAFKGKVKHLVVMGEVAEQIMETCRAYGFEQYERVNSLRDAVTVAFTRAAPGDSVLLSPACASWDMFDNYEQRGYLFKQFVHELRDNRGQ